MNKKLQKKNKKLRTEAQNNLIWKAGETIMQF